MIHNLLIIPILGAVKNYVKYKRVSLLLFLRTPIIYSIFYTFLWIYKYKNKISLTIINERIFMFLYKIIYSILIDKYHKNKLKYIKKYNILYSSNQCLEDLNRLVSLLNFKLNTLSLYGEAMAYTFFNKNIKIFL